MNDDLKWLSEWVEGVSEQRPEDEIVFRIENVDNPGWLITLDALDAGLKPQDWVRDPVDYESGRWLRVRADDRHVRVACGSDGLDRALEVMWEIVEAFEKKTQDVN